MVVNNNDNRERWILTNISASELAFGELPLLPTISSGEAVDLLIYYEKDEIQQSKQIPMALTTGFISMQKVLDDISTDVEDSDYVTVAERSIIEEIKDETIFNSIQLNPDLVANPDYSEGLIFYDNVNECLAVYNSEAEVTLQVGQEQWVYVENESGVDIANGDAVYLVGSSANDLPSVVQAQADAVATSFVTGLATHDIADGTQGFITISGVVRDIDTSAFAAGDEAWLSDTVAGGIEASEPAISFYVGRILNVSATAGSIYVNPNSRDYYSKSQINNIVSAIETGSEVSVNVLTVSAITGSVATTYASVEEAIDEIDSYAGGPDAASATNRYVIHVSPGTYVEDNPLTIPSYVTLQGWNDEASVIQAFDDNAVLFNMNDDSQIYSLRTIGPANDVAILVDNGDEAEIVEISIKGCSTGLQVDGVGSSVTIENSKIKSDVTTGLLATDSGSISSSNILSSAITTHFYANGGSIWIQNSGAQGGTNGVYANNAGSINVNLLTAIDTTNVVRANNSSTIRGMTIESRGSTGSTWDILQEDASHMDIVFCTMSADKISRFDASVTHLSFHSEVDGDEGLVIYEELHVGSPERGRESVFGEGSSYTRGMLVYTETALGVFTDVSTAAASITGSTFTFPGIAAENAIYVSSDLQDVTDYKQFLGIKMANTTALAPGVGEIVAEYWDSVVGGGSWVEFNTLSTLVNAPHSEYANKFFERANASENIRFDKLTDVARFDWDKNDPPTTGTNRYWIRFRVKTDVTTVPVFEQFKLHVGRTKISDKGFIEYMGSARQQRKIENINLGNIWEVDGFAPKDSNTDFGAIINLKIKKNKLENGNIDGFGASFAVPSELDTSMPLIYTVRWAPDADLRGG